jgi:hypothetical protein
MFSGTHLKSWKAIKNPTSTSTQKSIKAKLWSPPFFSRWYDMTWISWHLYYALCKYYTHLYTIIPYRKLSSASSSMTSSEGLVRGIGNWSGMMMVRGEGGVIYCACLGEVSWNGEEMTGGDRNLVRAGLGPEEFWVIAATGVWRVDGVAFGLEVEGDGAEGCLKWDWWGVLADSVGAGPIGEAGVKSVAVPTVVMVDGVVVALSSIWSVVSFLTSRASSFEVWSLSWSCSSISDIAAFKLCPLSSIEWRNRSNSLQSWCSSACILPIANRNFDLPYIPLPWSQALVIGPYPICQPFSTKQQGQFWVRM